MATTTAVSANPTRNNGATVVWGGTADGNNVTNLVGRTIIGSENNIYGTWQLASSGNTAPHWKRSAGAVDTGVTTHVIRRVSANVIFTGSSKFRNSIHHNFDIRTSRFINPIGLTGGWSYTTGLLLQGAPASGSHDDLGVNGAGFRPSRVIPGEYAIMQTGKTPTQGDYEEKTG